MASSDRKSKVLSRITRPDQGTSVIPSVEKLPLKPAGVSFVPAQSTDTGATTLPDESLTSIVEDKSVVTPAPVVTPTVEVNQKSLSSLTPICIQNTDSILNTLLFMCLDQGHDFRAGDSRTTTQQGASTWVDYDFQPDKKKLCYLNKIRTNTFKELYYSDIETEPKEIGSELIFGQNDFIKGLLNTTLIGGNGAYGLVVVEYSDINKLGEEKEKFISDKITQHINIKLKYVSPSYYIYSDNDCLGSSGINIKINDTDDSKILFLPFYQRVYNEDMHKLWTFNTKKYIYLIKLNNVTLVRGTPFPDITEPKFSCELFTLIDLIVPQYVLNFGKFADVFKAQIKEIEKNPALIDTSLFPKFFENLFTGTYRFLTDTKGKQTLDVINYSNNIFNFESSDKDLFKYVPRGTKYYFPNCQSKGKVFNFFLEFLYKYQKPFIHPEYKINTDVTKYSDIEQAKTYIMESLTEKPTYIELYDALKNYKDQKGDLSEELKELLESFEKICIEKQYGFVTDTNIGFSKNLSTADILIDKFNNLPDSTICNITSNVSKSTASASASARTDSESMGSQSDNFGGKKMTGGKNIKEFDNLKNVKEVFDLDFSKKTDHSFYKINSTTSKNFKNIIAEYSNNLQLYYDYISEDKGANSDMNYFNNCWNPDIFYQEPEQTEEQAGGSNYPFKFTIASGQLDSSALGGQSIPQYHPPEIDIYMPIFQIKDEGKLQGIIVRMVFVKEVLVNSINSKSQTIVFCHFVYVDFFRTGTTEPTNRSEYPAKIGELLKYAIDHTEYVKDTSSCINSEELSKEDINSDKNVDFKLKLADNKYRNWYKYYTYTQGPTVQKSIVLPTDYNSILGLKQGVQFDYVASGIVNVAEYLIKNSKQLLKAFNIDENISDEDINKDLNFLFFIKLFLIRNKYTGDKSRSTDTLFLNQTKYLEGVQVSNDENTLYNAQMFGLNTIWSTSAKSVFYMSPYLTKDNRFPLTRGIYVPQLCSGLEQNPNFAPVLSGKETGVSSTNDEETEYINEFKEAIMSTIDFNDISPSIISDLSIDNKYGIPVLWSEGESFLKQLYLLLNQIRELPIEAELESAINDYLTKYIQITNKTTKGTTKIVLKTLKEKTISPLVGQIIGIEGFFGLVKSNIDELNVRKNSLYKKLAYISTKVDDKANLNNLFDMILFLSKTFPWWLNMIITNIEYEIYKISCKNFISILKSLNNLLTNENIQFCDKFEIYKYMDSLIEDFSKNFPGNKCFNITDKNNEITKISSTGKKTIKDYKQCPNQADFPMIYPLEFEEIEDEKPPIYLETIYQEDIEDKSPQEQEMILELNDTKFNNVSVDFIELLQKNRNPDKNLSEIDEKKITDLALANDVKKKPRPLKSKVREVVIPLRGTAEEYKPGIVKSTTSGQEERKEGEEGEEGEEEGKTLGGGKNADMINNFYKNTYKCNVGNYLKNFIPIIEKINTLYYFLNLRLKYDTAKDIVIKILLLYIQSINNSYIPKINSNSIINSINKIDGTYTTEQMNTIINTYSRQLDTYIIIDELISNNQISNIDLINILNNSISYNTYISLNISIPFIILKNIIMNKPIPIQFQEEEQEEEQKEEVQTKQQIITPKTNIQSQIDYTKLVNEPYMIGRREVESEQPNYSMGLAYGGISFKNRKRNKNFKTIKNKVKSRKQTIKRRNKKHKYSRRH